MASMAKEGSEIEGIGINYAIHTHKKPNSGEPNSGGILHVLKDVHFHAKPWEILAIVGPSGAGKSSLLEIISGKLIPQTSSIFINQKPINNSLFKKTSGYVTQKDTLFPLLTVEETLMFTSQLRLNLPVKEHESRVKSLIQELGLTHIAATRIGDDKTRGISGGERRRVSIGVEIVHDPRILILDEPTSGLDSVSALQIICLLKSMAENGGKTIILSIHQPGFRIIKLFNSILLLANGSVLHHGTIDQLDLNLKQMGLIHPINVNIVDFAIDSIEAFHHQPSIQKKNPKKNKTLQQLFIFEKGIDYTTGFSNSRIKETLILTHRFSKNIIRTKELFACRTLQMLISGLVLGSIFFNLKQDINGVEERIGLFAFILTFLLSSTTEALPIFLQEKEILMKETSSGSYRVSSYAIANSLVYLPFLLILAILFSLPLYLLVGLNHETLAFSNFLILIWLILYTANSVGVCFSALVPNFIVGNSVISGVMGSFFLFSGYFISKQEIPSYWIFMHYLSLFKYPFEGFLINEFAVGKLDKCFGMMFGECVVNGEDVLKEEGFGNGENRGKDLWRNVLIMICFGLVYRFLGYLILRFKCSQPSQGRR